MFTTARVFRTTSTPLQSPKGRCHPGRAARLSLLGVTFALMAFLLTTWSQTVVVSINAGDNGFTMPDGDVTVPANSDLDIFATPDPGYKIVDWTINGQSGGWDVPKITLHLGDLSVSVGVIFARITNLVHVTVGPDGQLSPVGNNQTLPVPWGETVVFTAQPDAGFHADTWSLDDMVVQAGGNTFALANVRSEQWLRLAFAADTYAVQAAAGVHGGITPTNTVSVPRGGNLSFLATPDSGYEAAVWRIDGAFANFWQTNFALNNVQTNHSVMALFAMPVVCGQNVLGLPRSAAEPDVFSYNASAGESVTLNLQGCGAGRQPALEFYTPSGQRLLRATNCGAHSVSCATAGKYVALVWMSDNGLPGPYSFSVASTICTAVATSIACGQTITNRVVPGGMPDLIRFDAYAGNSATLIFESAYTNGSSKLRVYSPAGNLVASAYPNNPGLGLWFGASGVYLVTVESVGGSQTNADYRLQLQSSICTNRAQMLACGGSITNAAPRPGSLGYAYNFVGNAGDTITLALSACANGGLGIGSEVYDPEGNRILNPGLGCMTSELTLTNAGTNLVMVYALETNSPYVLSLNSSACVERPQLRLDRQGSLLLLSWPLSATNWVLDVTLDLSTNPTVWATVPPSQYQEDPAKISFTVPAPWSGNRFYRLRQL